MAENILHTPKDKSSIDSPLNNPASKKCPDCRKVLPESQFYKNERAKDGLGVYCKSCVSIRMKSYYQKNRERIIQRNSAYVAQKPVEQRREIAREYRQSERGNQVKREQYRRYRKIHKDKYKARTAVFNAVAIGKLPKVTTLTCFYSLDGCTIQATEYHHHAGYDRENWLTVRPVCLNCHRLIEGRNRKEQ